MAFFDRRIECKNNQMKQVRVPSLQGGTDRNIYVNGSQTGYYLGNGNNKIYRAGREISSLSVEEFAKQSLGFVFYIQIRKPQFSVFSLKQQIKLINEER